MEPKSKHLTAPEPSTGNVHTPNPKISSAATTLHIPLKEIQSDEMASNGVNNFYSQHNICKVHGNQNDYMSKYMT